MVVDSLHVYARESSLNLSALSEEELNTLIDEKISRVMKETGALNISSVVDIVGADGKAVKDSVEDNSKILEGLATRVRKQEEDLGRLWNKIKEGEIKEDTVHKMELELSDMIKELRLRIDEEKKVSNAEGMKKIVQEMIQKEGHTLDNVKSCEPSEVNKIVKSLVDLYAADRVGKVDYALGSSGGQVVSATSLIPMDFDTQILFTNNKSLIEKYLPEKYLRNLGLTPTPQSSTDAFVDGKGKRELLFTDSTWMIMPSLDPGNCWAFPGRRANVTLKLYEEVEITHVSVDHVHKKVVGNGDGDGRQSAPNEMKLYGWSLDKKENKLKDQVLLLEFNYDLEGEQIQTFPVKSIEPDQQGKRYQFVTFEILSNHGSYFTCIYRFRVHSSSIP
eukprot:TRINITY_DN4872_c0_g1_i1.p1 TRINITY_DN4872_c0_g1~~TRINITY_DN4872_c0_g1_i1.p1  ORF type:complete len:390 (-),score=110.70 TRINITY_DN4872_c0_g1_i1:370-1539(-)